MGHPYEFAGQISTAIRFTRETGGWAGRIKQVYTAVTAICVLYGRFCRTTMRIRLPIITTVLVGTELMSGLNATYKRGMPQAKANHSLIVRSNFKTSGTRTMSKLDARVGVSVRKSRPFVPIVYYLYDCVRETQRVIIIGRRVRSRRIVVDDSHAYSVYVRGIVSTGGQYVRTVFENVVKGGRKSLPVSGDEEIGVRHVGANASTRARRVKNTFETILKKSAARATDAWSRSLTRQVTRE